MNFVYLSIDIDIPKNVCTYQPIDTSYPFMLPTPGGDSAIEIVEGAAHSELDPGMTEAMARALDSLVKT